MIPLCLIPVPSGGSGWHGYRGNAMGIGAWVSLGVPAALSLRTHGTESFCLRYWSAEAAPKLWFSSGRRRLNSRNLFIADNRTRTSVKLPQ